jgi:hypothetical protein
MLVKLKLIIYLDWNQIKIIKIIKYTLWIKANIIDKMIYNIKSN